MNQYLLSVYEVEGAVGGAPQTPQEMRSFMARVMALEEEMDVAGAFAFGGALHGSDAATVVRGGTGLDKVTTDGPFVEAKEHIGASTSSTPRLSTTRSPGRRRSWRPPTTRSRCARSGPPAACGPDPPATRGMDDVERAFREAHGSELS